jgi:peptidoglycan/xylan/chitin deacetylase (PgdA/CDA1 family)
MRRVERFCARRHITIPYAAGHARTPTVFDAMRLLALKIDVDTYRGTREGVPPLVDALKRHGADATFLWSLGPDHTGRAIRRLFRPGFLSKVSRTSVLEHYGLRTLLYGTLLPGPDIGRRCAALMREVAAQGFEMGIHCWDHIRWQDFVADKPADWTAHEMQRAFDRFTEIFGTPPKTHGAAGWQMNEAAYAMEAALGFDYASDGRGDMPFQPVDASGQPFGVPQLPTTLPTLDELIGLDGWHADNVHEHLLRLTEADAPNGHVYTLHAELEGMRLRPTFERLLTGWTAQGYTLVSTAMLFKALDPTRFPHRRPTMGEIPGRSGQVAIAA